MPLTLTSPIFVVGAGRTGTTLLRTLLAAHPRIAMTPETHYMKRAVQFGLGKQDAPEDFDAFMDVLTDWSRFRDLGVSAGKVRTLAAGHGSFRDVLAAMMIAYAQEQGKPRVGEKTPGHYRWWRRLLGWFPDARIIAVRRDPRASAASALRAPWTVEQMRPEGRLAPFAPRLRLTHVASEARGWKRIYGSYVPDALTDRRVMLVEYEALMNDAESILRGVCDFIGEEFDPAMIAGRGTVAGALTAGKEYGAAWDGWVAEHEARASAPIGATDLNRWRKALSVTEIGVIEAICGPEMEQAGYSRISSSPALRVGAALGRTAGIVQRSEQSLRDWVGRRR